MREDKNTESMGTRGKIGYKGHTRAWLAVHSQLEAQIHNSPKAKKRGAVGEMSHFHHEVVALGYHHISNPNTLKCALS